MKWLENGSLVSQTFDGLRGLKTELRKKVGAYLFFLRPLQKQAVIIVFLRTGNGRRLSFPGGREWPETIG